MSPFAALTLYPLWAVAVAIGLVALRLGRARRTGLVLFSFGLSLWVTGLILLESGADLAERVLPFGMLLAGAVVHAGVEVADVRAPRLLAASYSYGIGVALLGAVAPRVLYGAGARGPGALFVPISALSIGGTAVAIAFLIRLTVGATRPEDRRRRGAVAAAALLGAIGGGGIIGLRVLAWGDVEPASVFLLASIVLVGYAVFAGEAPRARDLLAQGAAQAVVTALLSAVGLTAFFVWLPILTPHGAKDLGWLVLVIFFAALPLEPLRMLLVERIGRSLFRRPIAVPDLAASVDASEARADQAERLAELGRVVSAVAHEMRNPLGVIAAQTKVLERRGAAPETLEAMRAQIERAKHFLDDLLRYGKPRPLDVRALDAGPAIRLAAENARKAHGEEGPTLSFELDAAGRIEVDPAALADVVTVLVSNACIAAGSVVRVAARAEGDGIVVVVEDDGPGVPEEILPRLFEPFVTGRGRDARHPGTGLGLAIAVRWMERHNGALRHERPDGGGARFVARFPARA